MKERREKKKKQAEEITPRCTTMPDAQRKKRENLMPLQRQVMTLHLTSGKGWEFKIIFVVYVYQTGKRARVDILQVVKL